ncbi:MAG TPA: hypothetical protein VK752_06100 [Bryobacteraceae bacterium]|jgi:hypothetical protein|nr:hypothetical protein [Bryobacteraceae bacterium]
MNEIQLVAASPALEHYLDANLPADCAPEILIKADGVSFNPPHQPIELTALNPNDGPAYHLVLAPKRGDRPVSISANASSEDPLAIETVRKRGQNFFVFSVLSVLLLLLANPFPYSLNCATWAFMGIEMVDQAAGSRDSRRLRQLFRIMLELCRASPKDIFGFNAVAGNSLARLHFVSHRPAEEIGPYAIQRLAARLDSGVRASASLIGPDCGYPVEVARFGNPDPSLRAEGAAEFVERLHSFNIDWTFNAAVAMEDGIPVIYVAPRDKSLRPTGWPSQFGFMEFVLGVGVASDTALVARVLSGGFDRVDWLRSHSSLRQPSVRRLL